MNTTKYQLGELITQRREKNNGLDLPIRGVSKEGFIPPKQIDADTSIYNVFYMGDFVFNPARMELNSIAFNDAYEKAICSSLYEVFYVHRTDIILPEYLALIVKQNWFTRYCEFLGQGSAREYCRFANISEIAIDVPPMDVQRKAVRCNKVITERIALKRKINDNLEAQLSGVYHRFFDASGNSDPGLISDLGEVVGGATPSTDNPEYFCDDGIAWISPKDLTGTGLKFIYRGELCITESAYNSCSTKLMPAGTVLFTSRAPVGTVAIAMNDICTNQGFKSVIPKKEIGTAFVYYFLKENKQLIERHASGTTFMEVSGNVLKSIPAIVPKPEVASRFAAICMPLFEEQRQNELEIGRLQELRQTLISSISSR